MKLPKELEEACATGDDFHETIVRDCANSVASLRDAFDPESAPCNAWAIKWLDHAQKQILARYGLEPRHG